MARKKPPCPITTHLGRCKEKTMRGSHFCKKHAALVTTELVPCTGEAHSNPYIDHCMMCAPRWGQREVLKAIEGSHGHSYAGDKHNRRCIDCGMPEDLDGEKKST